MISLLRPVSMRFFAVGSCLLSFCLMVGCNTGGPTDGEENAGKINPRFKKLQGDKPKADAATK